MPHNQHEPRPAATSLQKLIFNPVALAVIAIIGVLFVVCLVLHKEKTTVAPLTTSDVAGVILTEAARNEELLRAAELESATEQARVTDLADELKTGRDKADQLASELAKLSERLDAVNQTLRGLQSGYSGAGPRSG